MKQNFRLEDVPIDVQKVWLLQNSGLPFGMKVLKEIEDIVADYSEWFEDDCDNKRKKIKKNL